MKIRVIRQYQDKENDLILRKAGDEYEVSEERGKHLISREVAEEVVEQIIETATLPKKEKKVGAGKKKHLPNEDMEDGKESDPS